MNPGYLAHLTREIAGLKEAGLFKTERIITSPQQPQLQARVSRRAGRSRAVRMIDSFSVRKGWRHKGRLATQPRSILSSF